MPALPRSPLEQRICDHCSIPDDQEHCVMNCERQSNTIENHVPRHYHTSKPHPSTRISGKPWFDNNLKTWYMDYVRALKTFNLNKTMKITPNCIQRRRHINHWKQNVKGGIKNLKAIDLMKSNLMQFHAKCSIRRKIDIEVPVPEMFTYFF